MKIDNFNDILILPKFKKYVGIVQSSSSSGNGIGQIQLNGLNVGQEQSIIVTTSSVELIYVTKYVLYAEENHKTADLLT